jgi:PleD family two-component response regulator
MNSERAALKPIEASAKILVASDSLSDAALVKKLLAQEFAQIFLSANPDLAVKDFESRAPDVLVLAFNSLEKSERYYLGLYRLSGKIHL